MGHVVDHGNLMPGIQQMLPRKDDFAALKAEVGPLFHFNPMCPCGHYRLHTEDPYHRLVLKRLMEISSSQGKFRKVRKLLDVSQSGDWEGFRNGRKDGRACEVSSTMHVGAAALYEFDFVSWTRPGKYSCQTKANDPHFTLVSPSVCTYL